MLYMYGTVNQPPIQLFVADWSREERLQIWVWFDRWRVRLLVKFFINISWCFVLLVIKFGGWSGKRASLVGLYLGTNLWLGTAEPDRKKRFSSTFFWCLFARPFLLFLELINSRLLRDSVDFIMGHSRAMFFFRSSLMEQVVIWSRRMYLVVLQ